MCCDFLFVAIFLHRSSSWHISFFVNEKWVQRFRHLHSLSFLAIHGFFQFLINPKWSLHWISHSNKSTKLFCSIFRDRIGCASLENCWLDTLLLVISFECVCLVVLPNTLVKGMCADGRQRFQCISIKITYYNLPRSLFFCFANTFAHIYLYRFLNDVKASFSFHVKLFLLLLLIIINATAFWVDTINIIKTVSSFLCGTLHSGNWLLLIWRSL